MSLTSYATDVAGNRVIVKVSKNNQKGEELYDRLEEVVEKMVDEYGHEEV